MNNNTEEIPESESFGEMVDLSNHLIEGLQEFEEIRRKNVHNFLWLYLPENQEIKKTWLEISNLANTLSAALMSFAVRKEQKNIKSTLPSMEK